MLFAGNCFSSELVKKKKKKSHNFTRHISYMYIFYISISIYISATVKSTSYSQIVSR